MSLVLRHWCHDAGYYTLERGGVSHGVRFHEFLEAVRQVGAQREIEALTTIAQPAALDWRAAAWYLSRRVPTRTTSD
jgi:hypothetical protein